MMRRMNRWGLCLVAVVLMLQGCEPVNLSTEDQQALKDIEFVVVLPLTDGPEWTAEGSSWVARGAVLQEMYRLGRYKIINIPRKEVEAAATATGYDVLDCYDPHVAAAIARHLEADAVACGEITHWSTRQEMDSSSAPFVTSTETKTDHYVGLSLRVVAADDAAILYTGAGNGVSNKGYTSAARLAAQQATRELREFCRRLK